MISEGGVSKQHQRKSAYDAIRYWESQLQSLGILTKRKNELNDTGELEALTNNLKEVYFQDYKSAYGSNAKDEPVLDKFHFSHIISNE